MKMGEEKGILLGKILHCERDEMPLTNKEENKN